MSAGEAGVALILFPLAYIVPVFLFCTSLVRLFSGSNTFKRDVVIVLLTCIGTLGTALLFLGGLTGNTDFEMLGGLYGMFAGIFVHIPALIIWLTCLGTRGRLLGKAEIFGLVVISPLVIFLLHGILTASR